MQAKIRYLILTGLFILSDKKGQAISTDFIFSFAVFILFLLILVPLLSRIEGDVREQRLQELMERSIISASDMLVKTPGYPDNWDKNNVSSIGLKTGDHLDKNKIKNLMEMDYKKAKDNLGLSGFEFYMNITDYKNQAISIDSNTLQFGNNIINGNRVSNIKRPVVFNNTISVLNMVIWV